MISQNDKISILIVGATGRLGSLITKHCLAQPKLLVNILVRDPQKNKELAASVEKAGGKVWKGDVAQPETLDAPLKGVHTVVSATSPFDPKTALDGQIALIDAAIRNGVKRFSPSDYAENCEKFTREEMRDFGITEFKVAVWEYLKDKPLKTIHFNPGVFMDSLFEFGAKDFAYWGNPDHLYDLTSYEDTAKYVAVALTDENRTGTYNFSAVKLTAKQVADIYNQVRGANIVPRCQGTMEELKNAFEAAKKADPYSFMVIMLGISLVIYDDRATFDKVHNSEFPSVKTTSIKEFLEQNPNAKLGQLPN